MAVFQDHCVGSLLGLALGDAIGAPYEGWSTESRPWKPMQIKRSSIMRYTDDTEMALGSAESLIACRGFSIDHMAQTWAKRADPNRGYGHAALDCLQRIADGTDWREANRFVYPNGSYGNGAAMRVAPLALFYAERIAELDRAVLQASSVTHAHSLGIQGAQIIARAIVNATNTISPKEILTQAAAEKTEAKHQERLSRTVIMLEQEPNQQSVVSSLGHGVSAHESISTALLIACWFLDRPFLDMLGFIVSVGGDVDTIGAMAGSIWGAYRGLSDLPSSLLGSLEDASLLQSYGEHIASMATN